MTEPAATVIALTPRIPVTQLPEGTVQSNYKLLIYILTYRLTLFNPNIRCARSDHEGK